MTPEQLRQIEHAYYWGGAGIAGLLLVWGAGMAWLARKVRRDSEDADD